MSGPCEDCAVGGAYWVRDDGASEKKEQKKKKRRVFNLERLAVKK